MSRSAGDYTARKAYCTTAGPCCPSKIVVDVSYNPVVDVSATVVVDPVIDVSCSPQVDISLNQTVVLDVSFSPVIDLSYNQTIHVDVSFNPTVDVSCSTAVDVSFNPSYTIDISFSPVITYDVSAVAVTSTVVANPDAFGRARVSNPYTLFEFSHVLGKSSDLSEGQVLIDEQTTGSGTSVWNPASYVEMDVSGVGTVVRQTHEYIVYQPGKSKLVIMTGVLYHVGGSYTTTGMISRIGSFDASMGCYFECSGGSMAVALRNNGTSAYAARAAWNLDPLDGTGACPFNVDFTKAQIFTVDFEWLGVGQVRCGIVLAGQTYYCHAFTHVNELDAPYIRTAKLPLRYELSGTAATRNAVHMICGTVISEGGFTPQSMTRLLPIGTINTKWALPNGTGGSEGVFVPLLTVQLRSTYPSRYGTIKVKRVDLFCSSSADNGSWRLILNGDVSGTPVDYDASGSIAQVIIHSTTPSAAAPGYAAGTGEILAMNFWSNRTNSILFTSTDELLLFPGASYNTFTNKPDKITLVANTFAAGGSATNVYAFIEWIEII